MIRLIQRRLIVPRGDTGTFSIPVLAGKDSGDMSIFTVFDPLTHRKVFEKVMELSDGVLKMDLTHGDTVNLPVGQYVWDIKFYSDPIIVDDQLVSGTEVDSYYSAFNLPICEIRETGDNLLMADDAPDSKLAPDQINYIDAAIVEIHNSMDAAVESATNAATSETNAATSAAEALASQQAAQSSQEAALTSQQVAQAAASDAANSAATASQKAAQIGAELENKADKSEIPTLVSQLQNDAGYLNQETDPTVPSWAKAQTKPTYTAQEVGALPANTYIPNKTSDLVNDSNYPIDANYVHTDNNYTTEEKNKLSGIAAGAEVNVNADWNAVSGDAFILNKPTNVSAFTNDAGYLTQHQDISMKANSADLAAVATSGDYTDLINKPTIPDIQIDGTSIVDNGIANIPLAQNDTFGIVRRLSSNTNCLSIVNGEIMVGSATNSQIKTGTSKITPIVPYNQHNATFYGLAKAAGDTTQSQSDNAVGTYTTDAKTAIQTMLDVPSNATVTSAISSAIGNIHQFDIQVVQALPTQDIQEHTVYFVPKTGETNDVYDEYIYINNAWEMVGNTQIDLSNYVQKTDYATSSTGGTVKINGNGLGIKSSGILGIIRGSDDEIKTGTNNVNPIVPYSQHISVFYGLASAAGDSTQSTSSNAVGTYTTEAKAAIRSMLGAAASADIPSVPVQDVQVNGTSILSSGVANIPIASTSSLGLVKYSNSNGVVLGSNNNLTLNKGNDNLIKAGENAEIAVRIEKQHISVFYGLAKAAGDITQSQSDNAVGIYTVDAKVAIQSMLGVPSTSDLSVYATKADTVLETSLSRGRKENTTIGTASFAFGYKVEASGDYSFGVGNSVVASGHQSKAEGYGAVSSGPNSHAEGNGTIANGTNMHAEGRYNIEPTIFPTWIANTSYNVGDKVYHAPTYYECIVDNIDSSWTSEHWNMYGFSTEVALVIGNGLDTHARSNAYMVDWSGNGHYMGNIYIGANVDSTGGSKVLCEADFATTQDIQAIISGGAGA